MQEDDEMKPGELHGGRDQDRQSRLQRRYGLGFRAQGFRV